MSIENLKNKELNQSQIDIVTGGDNGDIKSEWAWTRDEVKPLYSVGQYVEVYDNSLHWTTECAQITSIKITNDPIGFGYDCHALCGRYYPWYTVRIEKTGESREVISDDIES